MNRNIKRNIGGLIGLIVILIIGALITGCLPAGTGDEQDQSIPDTDTSGSQGEAVQDPLPEPEDGDRPSNPESPTAAETPASPPVSETPAGISVPETPGTPIAAETPDETSPEAIQRPPAEPEFPADQSVASGPAVSVEWELLASADVNRDGLEEGIYLDQTEIDSGYVTLRVCNGDENEIWNEQAGTSHAGWNSLFLFEQGGEHYLLRYNPGMWQGSCTYTYILFTLEGADENVIGGDIIDFDINGTKELDAPKMVYFAETVNSLLDESILLVSSEGGKFTFGPSSAEPFFERYSWLDAMPELYERGDDLETRLYKYSEFMRD